jgi:hypothetical protein
MGYVFRCFRCGRCCRSLITREWSGLSLFPWEKHLFTASKVVPSLGYGESPKSRSFRVFLYKYVDPVCEKLRGDECSIHDSRPLVCRSYPFRYFKVGKDKAIYEAAPECKAVQMNDPKNRWGKFPELYSAEEIGYHLIQFYSRKEPKWRYDDSGRWRPLKAEQRA